MPAPTTTASMTRRQLRRASSMTQTAANAAAPTNAAVWLNSMPAQTATDRAASPRRDHSRSSREVSASTSNAMHASAVYCFRSLRWSIAGTRSTPIPAVSPAATETSGRRQPSRRANQ